MFSLCQAMEFRHLPMAGGLYDQNPEMLDRFKYLFGKINEQHEKEEAERKRTSKQPNSKLRRGASRAHH